jgi:hypothetical protein
LIAPGARHTVNLCKMGALREIAGDDVEEAELELALPRRAVWPN